MDPSSAYLHSEDPTLIECGTELLNFSLSTKLDHLGLRVLGLGNHMGNYSKIIIQAGVSMGPYRDLPQGFVGNMEQSY